VVDSSERVLCIYQSQSIIKPNEVIATRAHSAVASP
jgi:hypothetical protein